MKSKLPTLPFLPSTSVTTGNDFHFTADIDRSDWLQQLTGIDIKGGQLLLFAMERQTDIFLSPAIFEERQERFISKLRAMLEYADQTQFCREQVLLAYFGEKNAVPCGHCDVCRELERIIQQPM